MAITKTSELTQIHVQLTGTKGMNDVDTGPWIVCLFTDTIDDPDDDTLPITQKRSKHYVNGDDVSGESELVQAIAAAVWAD